MTLCNEEVQDFLLLICNKSFRDVEVLIVDASLYEMEDIYEFGAEEYSEYWRMLGDEVCCQEYLWTIAEKHFCEIREDGFEHHRTTQRGMATSQVAGSRLVLQ